MADKDQDARPEKDELAGNAEAQDGAKEGAAAAGKEAKEGATSGKDGQAEAKGRDAQKDAKAKNEKAADRKQAKAAKAAKPKKKHKPLATPVWIVIAVVCAVAGGLVGHFAFNGSGSAISGKTTVDENGLNTVMGTYTYDGKTYDVTVEDVIKQTSSLDSAKQDDGTYEVPSADGVLSVARTQILLKDADSKGITVSDDDVSQYAQDTLGSSDFDSIAKQYSMDTDDAKELIRQSAIMKKLQEQVVGDTSSATAPTAPTEPSDGNKETTNSDYAQYIINLAGDEWDSDNNTWKDSSSDYATALADYTITNDSASYEAAQTAYYVAYQKYSQQQSEYSQNWTNYVNGLLQNASCSLGSLVA